MYPPSHVIVRTAKEDIEINSSPTTTIKIKQGEGVILHL